MTFDRLIKNPTRHRWFLAASLLIGGGCLFVESLSWLRLALVMARIPAGRDEDDVGNPSGLHFFISFVVLILNFAAFALASRSRVGVDWRLYTASVLLNGLTFALVLLSCYLLLV